jgi:molecular chaperone DnaK
MRPRRNDAVVGLDFGTSYCAVTSFKGKRFSEVLFAETGDRNNPRLLPSVVHEERGQTFIGQQAQAYSQARRGIKLSLNQTLSEVNSQMATAFQDAVTLFRHLREATEEQLEGVNAAVVTVPAYFSHTGRQNIKRAAEKAGWRVARLLPEPVAAAVAFLHQRKALQEQNRLMLVYDFGGGTVDISVVRWDDKQRSFAVLAKSGDPKLGGERITCIFGHRAFEPALREVPGIFNDTESPCGYCEYPTAVNATVSSTIQKAAEYSKRVLSEQAIDEQAGWRLIPDLSKNITLDDKRQNQIRLLQTRRRDLESWIGRDIRATMTQTGDALSQARVKPSDIDDVILAGGASRMPIVRQLLETTFDSEKIGEAPDLDLAVAQGAALVASGESKSAMT